MSRERVRRKMRLQNRRSAQPNPRTDVILPMKHPYMSQIVSGIKNFEFRKYKISSTVKRVWFYVTAPESRISHVWEIGPAITRTSHDKPLPLTGMGNQEFNERHSDWAGYDFAYEILAVHELQTPLTLDDMKNKYGYKSAPRGLVYVIPEMIQDFSIV